MWGGHRHDAVRANILGVAAQGDGRRFVAVRGGGDDRHAPVALLDDDADPALAFLVGHGGEFPGVGRADKAGRAPLYAEVYLPPQGSPVQRQIFRKTG